jgi:TonB family protein
MANYGDLIYSRYRAAWIPPLGLEDESISVTASVTIARDGQVLRHEITKRSGNAAMDASIDSTLENVTFIEAFPAGSTDSQRTFTIKFTPGRDGQ